SAAAPLWPARAALPAGAGRARSVPPPVWGARGELGARAGAVHAPRGVHGCPTRGAPRGAAAHKREKAARPNGSDKKASASGATKAAGAGARGAGAGAARPVHGRRRGADARARDRAAPPMLSRRGATLRPREESADRAGVCEALSSCSSSSPVLRTARHKQTEETSHKKHRGGGGGGGGGDERRKSPGHLLLQPAAGRQRGRAWPDAPLDGGAEVEGGRRSRCFIRVSRGTVRRQKAGERGRRSIRSGSTQERRTEREGRRRSKGQKRAAG
ncbi:unnamed protein product, partial [Prorocentrum cordatum]